MGAPRHAAGQGGAQVRSDLLHAQPATLSRQGACLLPGPHRSICRVKLQCYVFAARVSKYDHSLIHHDHQPYYVRIGDSWTKIDYSKQPREWMVPLQRGRETDLIEIPASWYLDDPPA